MEIFRMTVFSGYSSDKITKKMRSLSGEFTETQKMADGEKSYEKICKNALTNPTFVCIIVCICFHSLHIYAERVNI